MDSGQKTLNYLKIIVDLMIFALIVICVVVLLFSAFNLFKPDDDVNLPPPVTPTDVAAQAALERANEAIDTVDLMLGFLEGASVLVTFALAAAALYGYRSTQQLREDMESELQKIQKYSDQLHQLNQMIEKVDNVVDIIDNRLLPDFNDLLQANQELSLRNYTEAYRYASQVVQRSPKNAQALYLAGWIELQYIPGKLDDGLKHLQQAMELDKDSLSIRAAYGVGLRRKGQYQESITYLYWQALKFDEKLIDFNRESFWAPLGGSHRDMGNITEAIGAYKKALDITPNSSYPAGNLANLYLQKHQSSLAEPDDLNQALAYFRKTLLFAERELANLPGDYYAMMDIAMSMAMSSNGNAEKLKEAKAWYENAIKMASSQAMLNVSRTGWERLLEYCPKEWDRIHDFLDLILKGWHSQGIPSI